MYIKGQDSLIDDLGITTELHYNNIPFCYHTWFARNYINDIEQNTRIKNVYEKCLQIRMEHQNI